MKPSEDWGRVSRSIGNRRDLLGEPLVPALAVEVRGVLGEYALEVTIFPDPTAEQMGALWDKSHKEYERRTRPSTLSSRRDSRAHHALAPLARARFVGHLPRHAGERSPRSRGAPRRGVLLFGTPILLLLGYGFIPTLTVVLPILGGSLLTALVHAKGYAKDATRVTVAIGYCTFAVFQIVTLAITARHLSIDYGVHAIYVAVGVVVFVLVDRLLYGKLDDRRYRRLFAAFLLASGGLLTYKAVEAIVR